MLFGLIALYVGNNRYIYEVVSYLYTPAYRELLGLGS